MTTQVDFSAEPLTHPISYGEVREGYYASGQLQANMTHLVTLGVYICKAITVYNPEEQHGVLAHLNGTTKPEKMVSNILEGYPYDPATAEVSIIEATQDRDTFLWPDIHMLADLFKQHDPRSLRIDRNDRHQVIRGIAFDLESGTVIDVPGRANKVLARSNKVPVQDQRIRKHLIGAAVLR